MACSSSPPAFNVISNASIGELLALASAKFLIPPSNSSWDEECELIITVLYMTLSFPKQCNLLLIKGVLAEFYERWFEDFVEFSSMLPMLKSEQKCSGLSTLFLLHANLLPTECDTAALKDSLGWTSNWFNKTPPVWLLNASACGDDLATLNSLLFVSAMMLKGDVNDMDFEDNYIGAAMKFLHAGQLYKNGDFEESLKCLQNIPLHKCGSDIQGWILWLMGLGLSKLEKPHTALLKLQAAVDKSEICIPAIFNIAQVFNTLDLYSAELETLSLLFASREVKSMCSAVNLQSSILALHHTPPADLHLRALFLLASRCFQLKMYTDARDKFNTLLEKLEALPRISAACSRTLLRPEDDIPELPAYECILILAAVAHMTCNECENALRILPMFGELTDLGDSNFYKSPNDVKISYITTAAGCLVRVEALSKIGENTDALKECIKIEQALSWVSGITDTRWDVSLLQIKTRLYQTLYSVHSSQQNQKSKVHYKRLTAQCLNLLRSETSSPGWPNVPMSKKLVMDNIYFYMKEKLDFHSL
nr:uncharacterized protein LOC123755402 isoform X2 [Procambarus clarkii]